MTHTSAIPVAPVGEDEEPSPLKDLRFAVVGAGRLGCSLALALQDRGAVLTAYVCRTATGGTRAAHYLGLSPAASLDAVAATDPDLYLVTVPDSALSAVAQDLARSLPTVRFRPIGFRESSCRAPPP